MNSFTLFLAAALGLSVILLLLLVYELTLLRKTLKSLIHEYQSEQAAREKLILRATADILAALKERDHESSRINHRSKSL